MARINYRIDADADTVIILKNPDAEFAPWKRPEAGGDITVSDNETAVNQPDTDESAKPALDVSIVEQPTLEQSNIEDVENESSVETALVTDSYSRQMNHCINEDGIWYYVSRRHLASASPTFGRMLSGKCWKEGTPDENTGLYIVTTENWDSEAMLCVLDVLHHRNRQVPRAVSLEILAKIAVLIDYYECAEALESFTERWVEHLQVTSPVPAYFCRDLMLWMCIAWVLRLPQEFSQTTTVALRRDDQELSTLGLPIGVCVDKIEEIRRQAIGNVFSQLQDLLQEFRSPRYRCPHDESFECGSILFGALTKEMELQGLLPIPTAPYSGLTFSELYTKMQRIRSPAWCRPGKSTKRRHHCDLGEKVMAIADPVTRLANGPQLKDFTVD